MSIISAQTRVGKLLTDAGRAVLNQRFPDEFEYYLMALELVNPVTNVTEDLFVFPVMPEDIRIRQPEITDIRKTAGGVAVLATSTYIPREISVSGTFGRKFRILLRDFEPGIAYSNSNTAGNRRGINIGGGKKITGIAPTFDAMIKTGYGATKVLYALLDRSNQLTPEGAPYQLFLYNLAFNDNHLVELLDKSVSQDMGNNMYWKYNLAFKSIAPASQIRPDPTVGTLQKVLKMDILQKAGNAGLELARQQTNLLRNKTLGSNTVVAVENTVSNFLNKL